MGQCFVGLEVKAFAVGAFLQPSGLLGEAVGVKVQLLFAPVEVGGEDSEALLTGLELALGGGFLLQGFSLLRRCSRSCSVASQSEESCR